MDSESPKQEAIVRLQNKIASRLIALRDPKRAAFQARLCPEIDPLRIYGLKMEQIRSIAYALQEEEADLFLSDLPHFSLEEDLMHVALLNDICEANRARERLESFLPYLQSWVQTDSLVFKKISDDDLLAMACELLNSPYEYGCRLGIVFLIKRACKKDPEQLKDYLQLALSSRQGQESHQLVMAKGWLLCEAMIHQPDVGEPVLENEDWPQSVRMKCISKCLDSYRISPERKQKLRLLRQSWKTKEKEAAAILKTKEQLSK